MYSPLFIDCATIILHKIEPKNAYKHNARQAYVHKNLDNAEFGFYPETPRLYADIQAYDDIFPPSKVLLSSFFWPYTHLLL